ncbi:hypothetical protein RND81_06G233700 [Saponaria officinalis]|uniref:Cytochrome P450 n=1 Tax=Saponaria officinalis TaxID=3572 RepID=A0AAW1KEB8_SAPOF
MLNNMTDSSPWLWLNGVSGQVLTALAISLVIYFILSTKRQTKGQCPPLPGPRGLPLVGYLPFLGPDLRFTFNDLSTKYGPIFKFHLGNRVCVAVNSPSHAKEVLKDQDLVFANRIPTVTLKLATFGELDIVTSDYGPGWRKLKKIFVGEMLSSANIDATYSRRKQQMMKTISKIYRSANESIDIGELIFQTIFGSVMNMVWGDTMKEEDSAEINLEFKSVFSDFLTLSAKPNISDYLPFLACFDLQGIGRKMKAVADKVESLFDLAIDRRFASKNDNHNDFLGHLLKLTKLDDPAMSLNLAQVKGILMDAIVGGVDTTATTVEWAMAELLKHPKKMRLLQEELAEAFGLDNTVDEAHLPKLKYLNAVLKETLRLHSPVALLIPHCSSKTTTVGGYTVPKTSTIFVNLWAIHRDPEVWEDPFEFTPERFLDDSQNLDFLGKKTMYIPFGSGRRMCPGLFLAEKMSMFVLSSLLHAFEWTLPDGTVDVDISEVFGMVVRKSKPTIAIPSPRLTRSELYSDE